MENFSIYKYMKLGIVHFKAYPEATTGEGNVIVETLRKIVEDDFWTAVEVGWMKDPNSRRAGTARGAKTHSSAPNPGSFRRTIRRTRNARWASPPNTSLARPPR